MTEKKEAGNKAFGTGEYLEAIGYYQEGLKVCPRSRQERAVLYGNTAACQLKLDKFEEAIASCDKGKEPFFFFLSACQGLNFELLMQHWRLIPNM